MADFVIDNSGDFEALDAAVFRCWQWMTDLVRHQPSPAHITPAGFDGPSNTEEGSL